MGEFITHSGTISNDFVDRSHQLGHLLYWHKQGRNSIQVRQDKSLRWLLINNTLQSVVELNHPEHLLFPHLKTFASRWQQVTPPTSVLELGLGAGAIRDYLNATYPNCHITTIDNNPDVIHCYKRYFGGDPLCDVNCVDVFKALQQGKRYDWIVLDLFSELEPPIFLFQHQFYRLLRAAINDGGRLYINFLTEHESQLKQLQHLLITNFGKKPFIEKVPDYANMIIEIKR
ncbi:SAM-dependent methyltransferase [Pseudoalteromonas sp. GCY]|uniref:spermidine synthase n=1 Tax=Pseudoalteromonas sp. GCY TaxID=2003316 RepID=UPI000BFF06B4|nr:SAM-dependent methyltransferase [Pseudoalteromonas sp. GCY]PHI35754.1 SAM-dependent methyltransferase [Pseudoalteromonas sp. GCY]QQQ67473.1 SAM-dependent methyltransferase [Pseudoalteromonas sp. GCY]